MPPKKETKVKIKKEYTAFSPHLLDLRLPQSNEQKPAVHSFEEKIDEFDKCLKQMPDLLKTQAGHFSDFFEKQKTNWQKNFADFMDSADELGKRARKQLHKPIRIRIAKKRSHPLQLPLWQGERMVLFFKRLLPNNFSPNNFSLLIILLFVFTIPFQGVLLYRFINTTQQNIKGNIAAVIKQAVLTKEAVYSINAPDIYREAIIGLAALGRLQNDVNRLGPARWFLPEQIKRGYRAIQSVRTTADDVLTTLSFFTGIQNDQHILIIFQNPRELRATGGFAGSLALLTTRNGQIVKTETPQGGTYDFQGQMPLNRLSPKPLHLINPRFELQDANWWPDFPSSARKIAEIYQASGENTVDGIIAITAYAAADLLDKAGPLILTDDNGKKMDFTGQNFIDQIQNIIAKDRAQNRQAPKKIISFLFPSMTDHLTRFAKSNPAVLLSTLVNSIQTKDIQIWSKQENVQAALRRLGLTGEMKKNSGDYLAVITSNVGGGKTDGQSVDEQIFYQAHLTAMNTVKSEITIIRSHHGKKGDQQTGLRNNAFIRFYVPDGARLISADGFNPPPPHVFEKPAASLEPDPDVRAQEAETEYDQPSGTAIWSENGKKVFGNWMSVDPGKTAKAVIVYETPITNYGKTLAYNLIIDTQAGKRAKITGQVILDDNLQLITGQGNGIWQPAGWTFSGILDKPITASGVLYKL